MIPGLTRPQQLRPRSGTLSEEPPDPGEDVLLETVTLDNWSGASRTDPYVTFRRSFEQGDVPSGSRVDLRYSGTPLTLQQADARTLHDDGSLRHATFSGKVPAGAVADNGTVEIDLYKTSGSFSNSTSLSRSTLTGHDYKIRVKISGTDYWCKLNNLDAAGTYRELRAGSTVRAWHHWGPLRAGQGGSDTDHGQLQARFYSYVWEDGRITVWPDLINGRVANGQAYTVDEVEFLDGASSIYSYTTDFTAYAHGCYALVATDGLPHWSSTATHLHARVSPLYLHDKKLHWNVQAGPTQIAAIGSGTAFDHVPNQTTEWGYLNAGGGNPWIGPLTQWSTLALLAGNKTRWRNDRVQALAQGWMSPDNYISLATGYLPTLTNTAYDGLGAKQPTIGWGVAGTISDSGGMGPNDWGALDEGHGPNFAYLQYISTGWEWWLDRMLTRLSGSLGSRNPGTDVYARNPIINSTQFYASFCPLGVMIREGAWGLRSADNLSWVIPDANLHAQYVRDVRDATLGTIAMAMTGGAQWHSDMATLGIWPGMLYSDVSDFASPPWFHGYMAYIAFMALHRGHIDSDHKIINNLSKWYFGGIIACPYHAMGALTVCFRQGANPTGASAVATAWSQVYYGAGGAGTQTEKLISDSGGDSGSCPSSGQASGPASDPYAAGHSYPSIAHAAASIGDLLGIENASAALAALAARETAVGLNGDVTDWNARPVFRMRAP